MYNVYDTGLVHGVVFARQCYAECDIAMASYLFDCLSTCDIEVLWS